MKGTNVDFSISKSKKSSRKSTDDNSKSIDGKIIDFSVKKAKKSATTSFLQGLHIDFSTNEIGRWSLEEKKDLACMICKLPIKANHKPQQCPMCKSIFHDDHIFEWLKVKGKCPVCFQALRPGGTEEVKN